MALICYCQRVDGLIVKQPSDNVVMKLQVPSCEVSLLTRKEFHQSNFVIVGTCYCGTTFFDNFWCRWNTLCWWASHSTGQQNDRSYYKTDAGGVPCCHSYCGRQDIHSVAICISHLHWPLWWEPCREYTLSTVLIQVIKILFDRKIISWILHCIWSGTYAALQGILEILADTKIDWLGYWPLLRI